MQVCPECEASNEDAHRFCAFCGSPLSATSDTQREIRFATALFVDIVDSTPLVESHDPEVVRELISRVFARLKAVIRRHGGIIEKTIGDGLLAIFGAPVAHEDHPERAVRAALEMREVMSELNATFATEGRPALQVRTGVEAGDILADMTRVRDGADAMVTGDAVNVSVRLQGAAEPGSILVGPEAFRLTDHAIEYRSPRELALKGKSRPLTAAEPTSVKARMLSRRLPVRYDTALIGRSDELRILRELVNSQATIARPRMALLIGPAGIGKSRLLSEIKRQARDLEQIVYWREGACLAYGDVPFAPIVDIFRAQFELDEGVTDADVRRALEDLFTDQRAPVEETKALFSPSETGPTRDQLFESWRQILERMTARYPLVLVFEDVHWADEGTIAFIDYLAEWGGGPILLILAARPDIYERHPVWQETRAFRTVIDLDPLTEDESRRLIHELVDADLPHEVEQDILARCGGSPLFAEEIAHHLHTADQSPAGGVGDIPRTLQSLISARLDTLPGTLKPVVQDAAVIGPIFTVETLGYLMDKREDEMRALLDDLVSSGIVAYNSSGESLSFHHVLVRDVAYSSLPKSTRADRHVKIGDWIEDHAPFGEATETLAAHFTVAARYLDELGNLDSAAARIMEKAYRLSVVAAERATALWQPAEAARWLEQALRWSQYLDLPNEEVARVWESFGEACLHARSAKEASVAFERALAIQEGLRNDRDIGRLEARLADVCFESADDEKLIEWTDRAIRHLEGFGDSADLADALHLRGWFLWRRSLLDEAEPFVSRALEMSRRVEDQVVEGNASLTLAVLQFERTGDPATAEELTRKGHEISRQAGDLALRLRACINFAAWLYDQEVGPDEIERLYKEGIQTGAKAGDILVTAWLLGEHAGFLETWGRLAEAEEVALRAIHMARSTGSIPTLSMALGNYTDIKLRQGDFAELDRVRPELQELMRQAPEKQFEKDQVIQDAYVAHRKGDEDAALAILQSGVEDLAPLPADVVDHDLLLLETTRRLNLAGRVEEARSLAARLREFADKASFTAMFADWASGVVEEDVQKAVHLLEAAAVRARRRDLVVFEGRILLDLARAQFSAGQDATETLDRARTLLETSGALLYLLELDQVIGAVGSRGSSDLAADAP
ncbi:MAG TPA: adenylate/guanylate cyclase domain-containing protein [Actinomycetota bacterium]|nr:adenylate/guanylate cyclase domain-containing protein [Actinomycetota bacterium]